MQKINKLTLKNFKFFYGETTINFGGKNALIYGENGSGKSSVYWALYTFLQSSFKTPEGVIKYFSIKSDEDLRNRFVDDDASSSISLEYEDGITRTISEQGITTKVDKDDVVVYETAMGSEFITHYTLSRIYAYYHKDEINLFDIFQHELFAFISFNTALIKPGETKTNFNAEVWWNFISTEATKLTDRDTVFAYLDDFNNNLDSYLKKIIESANDYITEKFEEKFNILFKYLPVSFLLNNEEDGTVKVQVSASPQIIMSVKILNDKIVNKDRQLIDSPQSFLNEAKLSTIALALRLAILDENYVEDYPKILVLDDMLLSMDMSNREFVTRVLLNEYLDKYQIFFLTHQRGLFEDIKESLQQHYVEQAIESGIGNPETQNKEWLKHWNIIEMYEGENTEQIPVPKVISSNDNLQKAYYYFKQEIDYNACGNNLRAHLESFFKRFIPSNFKKASKDKHMLDSLLKDARSYFDYLGFNTNSLNKLERYLKRSLNKTSHHNPKANFYKKEMQDIFSIIEELHQLKNYAVLKVNDIVNFTVKTQEGNNYKYEVTLLDNILLYKEDDSKISFFKMEDKRSYNLIAYYENEVKKDFHSKEKNKTLQELYDFTLRAIKKHKKENPIVELDVFRIFKNTLGKSLEELKMY